jgi:L-fuculose-phosphate aldolase
MMFRKAREEVVETCLLLADQGYLAGTGGNIALRADARHFLVTPSATDYYAMDTEDICVLRFSDNRQVEGNRPASVESVMHARVLLARPGQHASIHTHQPVASAYTLLAQPLDIRDESLQSVLGDRVPCVDYAPSGTDRLARRVEEALSGQAHACLMRNHGVVGIGVDAREAAHRVNALEIACADYFLSRMAKSPMHPPRVVNRVERALQAVALGREEGLTT